MTTPYISPTRPGKFQATPVSTSTTGRPQTSTVLRAIAESDLPSDLVDLIRGDRAVVVDAVAGSTIYPIVHNLGRSTVTVTVYEGLTGIETSPRPIVTVESDNQISLAFFAPTIIDHRVIIQ